MSPGSEEDETPVEKARYEGEYKDGLKHGVGTMTYPNKDTYSGEWVENKVSFITYIYYYYKDIKFFV